MTPLNSEHPIPKYFQLAEILRKKIFSGEWGANMQIPTEEELTDTYDVSRGTVRKALELLETDGLINRHQGRGTFVEASDFSSLMTFSLMDTGQAIRENNGPMVTRTLAFEEVPAPYKAAHRLETHPGVPLVHIIQQKLQDGIPVIREERYFEKDLCPGILSEDLEEHGVHWLLSEKYNIPLLRVEYSIEARNLSKTEADYLDAQVGMPAFFVDRVTFLDHQKPAVWYRAIYRGEYYRFSTEFRASL